MSRLYRDEILVANKVTQLTPIHTFIWHSQQYRVKEVLGTWHLCNRWWKTSSASSVARGDLQPSDRFYYRVECTSGLLCDIYFDTVSRKWILDRVHD